MAFIATIFRWVMMIYRKEHSCQSSGAGDRLERRLHVRRRIRRSCPRPAAQRSHVATETVLDIPLQEIGRTDEYPTDADHYHRRLVQRPEGPTPVFAATQPESAAGSARPAGPAAAACHRSQSTRHGRLHRRRAGSRRRRHVAAAEPRAAVVADNERRRPLAAAAVRTQWRRVARVGHAASAERRVRGGVPDEKSVDASERVSVRRLVRYAARGLAEEVAAARSSSAVVRRPLGGRRSEDGGGDGGRCGSGGRWPRETKKPSVDREVACAADAAD